MLGVASYVALHALVGSTEVGWKCKSCWGALRNKMRCLAIRPRRECGVPHSQHPATVFDRRMHGYTGSTPARRGQRRGKGGGAGVGK